MIIFYGATFWRFSLNNIPIPMDTALFLPG